LGDGYRRGELSKFHDDVEQFWAEVLKPTPPFDQLWPAINVHRVDVTSAQSGADMPCHGVGPFRTFFDASYCDPIWGPGVLEWLLTVNEPLAKQVASGAVREWNVAMVLVNAEAYGGSGAPLVAVASTGSVKLIGLHELGHSALGLADEYDTPVPIRRRASPRNQTSPATPTAPPTSGGTWSRRPHRCRQPATTAVPTAAPRRIPHRRMWWVPTRAPCTSAAASTGPSLTATCGETRCIAQCALARSAGCCRHTSRNRPRPCTRCRAWSGWPGPRWMPAAHYLPTTSSSRTFGADDAGCLQGLGVGLMVIESWLARARGGGLARPPDGVAGIPVAMAAGRRP
jgi:hypothetical protein